MWSQPPADTPQAGIPRRAILLWATLLSLALGAINFARPIDDVLRTARNVARSHPATGDIVVVAIDDRSIEKFGRWPWSRGQFADVVNAVGDAGAARIAVAESFSGKAESVEDAKLAAAFDRFPGKIALAVRAPIDPQTRQRSVLLPTQTLASRAELVNATLEYNSQSRVWLMNYAIKHGGQAYPSLAAFLADRSGPPEASFFVDYSTALSSLPVVSVADLLSKTTKPGSLAGKSVIIGTASQQFSDQFFIPGVGAAPAVFLHAIGAETLEAGMPYRLGWLLPFTAIWLFAAVHLLARTALVSRLALAAGALLVIGGPFVLESRLVFAEIMPSALLLMFVASARRWFLFRRSYRERGRTNAVSGLPNLDALREDANAASSILVAARVQNFAEMVAALPENTEKSLVEQIAARLAMGSRGETVYQGDEGVFVWLAAEDRSAPLGDQLDALHAICRTPVSVAGSNVDLAVSFGIDTGTERSVANRIGGALVAAAEAFAQGKHWKQFDAAKLKDAAWNLSLLGRLDTAIDTGEIWVAYQPKLDLARQCIVGAEALVRWNHAEKGEIGPADFIPAAEQHNRIDKLTSYVLEDGIRTAASMIASSGSDFDVAVNLSARLLDRPDLVGRIQDLLRKHGVAARHLTLEVTESAALTGHERSLALLEELRSIGLNISIDDYGTGFSTLSYLKSIPANEIKIDRSFVKMIDRSQSDRLLVDSTIHLAHSLGRTVVAEGVETPEVLRALEAMGCDKAQGYLIGRPMPVRQLAQLLFSSGKRSAA